MAKETYSYGKRDLFIWQKTPMSKEACVSGKRDPQMSQKRPMNILAYLSDQGRLLLLD